MAIDKNKILEYYLKLKNSIKPGEWKSSEINLSPEQDTISKFSHSGDDTTEIKKILLEYEEGTRGTQSNETASKGKKVGLYTDSKLEEIAKKYFNVETLETRKSDSIDFKDVAVWNIKSALAEAGRDMLSDSELEKIAKDQLFLDTLKTRNSDSLDFSEQSVWGLKGALQEANHLGVQKLRNTAKTGTQIEQGVWDFDTEGNLYTMVDRTKYKIVYRDDESKLYDLFEDGKLIYSDRSIFKLKQEVMPKETAAKGKNVDAPLSYEGITEEDIDKYYGASIPMPGERNAELFKRHRELHKALLHFEKDPNSKFYINTAKTGTKINEMKNNYYYLKIGNVIKEPKYNNSLEIVAFERDKIKVKEISKILKNTTADFIDYETFVSYMNFGDITIEGCTYETDRDKLLLKMEIDNIQASFKESEFKQQANTLMAEASTAKTEANQVKKEANALLNKLESKTKGFEDTIAGVEAVTSKNSVWDNKLNALLAQFPNDAKSWGQATDEIREIARQVRETYNEQVLDVVEGDDGYVEGLNFREFGKPHQWNTEAKKFILHYWALLTENLKKSVIESRPEWFNKAGFGTKIKEFFKGKKKEPVKTQEYEVNVKRKDGTTDNPIFPNLPSAEKHKADMEKLGHEATITPIAAKGNMVGGAFKHTNDTYLPDAYYKEFKLKGNGKSKYNIFQSHSSSDLRQAVKQLFPTLSKGKHEELAKEYANQEVKAQSEYNALINSAFKEHFGREYEAKDYKVSGIVRDEFSDDVKNKLRDLVKQMNEYEGAKTLHEAGAGKTFSTQAKKGTKVKKGKCPSCSVGLQEDQLGVLRCYNEKCSEYGLTAQVKQPKDNPVKKKAKSKGPKRGTTTLAERNYMKKFKKEFESLKDAYPDLTFKQLIEKHKNANKK